MATPSSSSPPPPIPTFFAENTLPMTVENMTFMLDRLGQDCAPLQFVRELTQNAIEAIRGCRRSRARSSGTLIGIAL